MSPSSTKRGPGRTHLQGDGRRLDVRSRYVQGLLNHWAKKRREAAEKSWSNRSMSRPRDAHGAVTLVGKEFELVGVKPTSRDYVLGGGTAFDGEPEYFYCRRIWLAGVSAQRGY
ncbi:hypothetical protein [Piscinibacter defluvii]|uniref:hypothetical protein n=1 Tax=Piscinibacter defluvii TaxID=1796922 RepID=UPI000FDE3BA0|nr:hypothetical protein [Piscinibacter defluvii]